MKYLFFSFLILFSTIIYANGNNDIRDLKLVLYSLNNQKEAMQIQADQYKQRCDQTKLNFNIDIGGLSPFAAALGENSNSTSQCQEYTRIVQNVNYLTKKINKVSIAISLLQEEQSSVG
ncbi:hypothetical protein [Francisella philomiragia]|uniref:hypothetical protein n=1 Tax=Francisella philomiragia TaxID=28110 RepID=UPI001906FCC6|nr:hypothetical protein [Francisella philomiragia]MBK2270176.1 hypothetical protein [Francisella philomiragia]MBK2275840.1 hypothetical protein [Francisella philomiragia]MBK2305053.1 hypothetical protein [Francisella philomiragia]